jgi:hypothetical protein
MTHLEMLAELRGLVGTCCKSSTDHEDVAATASLVLAYCAALEVRPGPSVDLATAVATG